MHIVEKKPYAFMAGVCYAIYGLYKIIERITFVQNSKYASITALNVIFWIAMIGIAVALFLKNEKAVIAAAGVNALIELYELIAYFNFLNLFCFIAYALVITLILLTLKKNIVVQKIWFTAGVAQLLGPLIYWDLIYVLYMPKPWIFFSLVEVGGLLLIGLWLKENDFNLSNAEPTNKDSKFSYQTTYSASLPNTTFNGTNKPNVCQKCGCEIDGSTPICMNCGAPIPDSQLTQETKERLETQKNDTHVASGASSVKAFGAFLLIIGFIIDVISMFLIFSSDYEAFNALTIGGTISFLIGITLLSNG